MIITLFDIFPLVNRPCMATTGTLSAITEAVVTHADWFFTGGEIGQIHLHFVLIYALLICSFIIYRHM